MSHNAKHEVCFSAATSACEKGHDWPKALQLLERMFDEHWTPDVVHFNSVDGLNSLGAMYGNVLGYIWWSVAFQYFQLHSWLNRSIFKQKGTIGRPRSLAFWRSRNNGHWHCRCFPWWQRRRWHRIPSHTMLPSVGQPRSGQRDFSPIACNSCYCFKKWFWNVLTTWDTFSHFGLGPNDSPESNSNENQTESLSPNGPSQVLPQQKTEALVVHTGVTLWCCFNIAKAHPTSTHFRHSEAAALAGWYVRFQHCVQKITFHLRTTLFLKNAIPLYKIDFVYLLKKPLSFLLSILFFVWREGTGKAAYLCKAWNRMSWPSVLPSALWRREGHGRCVRVRVAFVGICWRLKKCHKTGPNPKNTQVFLRMTSKHFLVFVALTSSLTRNSDELRWIGFRISIKPDVQLTKGTLSQHTAAPGCGNPAYRCLLRDRKSVV